MSPGSWPFISHQLIPLPRSSLQGSTATKPSPQTSSLPLQPLHQLTSLSTGESVWLNSVLPAVQTICKYMQTLLWGILCTEAYRSTLPTPHLVQTSRDCTQPWPSGSWLESTMGNQGSRRWKGRGREVWALVPLATSLQLDCSRINLPPFWWPFQQFHLL